MHYLPRPQGLLLVQNGGRRNPWPRLPKWLRKFVRISSRKHDEMSSFCLNNGFRLQKPSRVARRWKEPPKKPFHRVSRDKILHDSWNISAALARGFSDHHFERGEGPGDEVGWCITYSGTIHGGLHEVLALVSSLDPPIWRRMREWSKFVFIKSENHCRTVILSFNLHNFFLTLFYG